MTKDREFYESLGRSLLAARRNGGPKWIDIEEVADILRMSEREARRAIANESITTKTGRDLALRYDEADVLMFSLRRRMSGGDSE